MGTDSLARRKPRLGLEFCCARPAPRDSHVIDILCEIFLMGLDAFSGRPREANDEAPRHVVDRAVASGSPPGF